MICTVLSWNDPYLSADHIGVGNGFCFSMTVQEQVGGFHQICINIIIMGNVDGLIRFG